MKNNGKQFNLDQRKLIMSCLAKGLSYQAMSESLFCDPSSVSKEVKRNRKLLKDGKKLSQQNFQKINRFPYVCNQCIKRYSEVWPLPKHLYDPIYAHHEAQRRLKETRTGIKQSVDSFQRIDETLSHGILKKDSIYHTIQSNHHLGISVSTAYRYVNKGLLSISRMDLPYAVRLKKRVKKKYDYPSDSPIDRHHRIFIDFLVFRNQSPGKFDIQMDFLGKIKSDFKSILTHVIPDLHSSLLFLVPTEINESVLHVFNTLEKN